MMNDEKSGERGRLARFFRRLAKNLPIVPREARDTAGGAPALPASSFSRERFLDFARNDKNLIAIR